MADRERSVITDEMVDLVAGEYVHADGSVHDAVRTALEALVAAGYEIRSRDELRTWHAERDYECAAHSEGLTCCVDRLLGDEPPGAEVYFNESNGPEFDRPGWHTWTPDESPPDKLDAGLAEAEYHAALDNLNAVRAEGHLTPSHWSAHRLRHHLAVDHGVPRRELRLDNELDDQHRQAHESEAQA